MEAIRDEYVRFHPQIITVNSGTVDADRNPPSERMCMFYEIELITGSRRGGVMTMHQLIPAEMGTLYFRTPGSIVKSVGSYSYFTVVFDTVFDPELEKLYGMGSRCLGSAVNLEHLKILQKNRHCLSFLDSLPPKTDLKNPELFLPYFENAFHHAIDSRPIFQLQARRELLSILTLLLNDGEKNPDPSGSLTAVKKFMDSHYHEAVTLDTLAEAASMNREYFCRRFHRVFGSSPMEYLLSLRLFHARYLLVSTYDTVSVISQECGFSSEQYFYRQFKKHTGMTPAQFRRTKALPTGIIAPDR